MVKGLPVRSGYRLCSLPGVSPSGVLPHSTSPSTRALFRSVDLSAQRNKLLQALSWVINNLEQPEALRSTLQELGRRHARYGVCDRHFQSVGAALLSTLEQGLGASWTPEVEAAWTAAYTMIASVMRQAMGDATAVVGSPLKEWAIADDYA